MAYDSPKQDFLAEAREIVARQAEAWNKPSFNLHGWAHLGGRPPETVEAVAERLQQQHEDRMAWRQTPRGRFVLACNELTSLGFHEAYAAYCAASRNFRHEGVAVDPTEVACALRALAPINHSTAREAIAALAEIIKEIPECA